MTNVQPNASATPLELYQGQFGEFVITEGDRLGVKVYRIGLFVAALSFAIATALALWEPQRPAVLSLITVLYGSFSLALGVSLLTIHIYLSLLHRILQGCWLIGTIAALVLAIQNPTPLPLLVFQQPAVLWGMGFTFVALTGIFFKEAFCFNRAETKLLTPIVPLVLLGHLSGLLPVTAAQVLLAAWAILMMVFAIRKLIQPIPPDIGDKSVFEYLRQQRSQPHPNS